jgi:hypothetical protein
VIEVGMYRQKLKYRILKWLDVKGKINIIGEV